PGRFAQAGPFSPRPVRRGVHTPVAPATGFGGWRRSCRPGPGTAGAAGWSGREGAGPLGPAPDVRRLPAPPGGPGEIAVRVRQRLLTGGGEPLHVLVAEAPAGGPEVVLELVQA